MSKIILDNNFYIELSNTYDLIEKKKIEIKDKDKKGTGKFRDIEVAHGYHNNLDQALNKYARLVIHNKNQIYNLNQYVNAIENLIKEALESAVK